MKFLVVSLIIISTGLTAIAGPYTIEVGQGWIKGEADAAPLGKVLARVAKKTGYEVYLDETLEKVPISFLIKQKLTSEEAIRRMVQPNIYAMVFGKGTGGEKFKILELRVFNKSNDDNIQYVHLKGGSDRSDDGNGLKSYKAAAGSNGILSDPGAGRSMKGKNLLRKDFTVKKNIFGAPVVQFRDLARGPDYRPNALEMKKAYEKFQRNKKLGKMMASQSMRNQERATSKQQQRRFFQKKQQALNIYKNKYDTIKNNFEASKGGTTNEE
jgi:hypothetical protein